jgi:WD40 repeat protein
VRSFADAHVLLIGTGNHDTPTGGDRLVDVPSVATTLTDLRAAFTERCGVPADRVRKLLDPADPVEFGDAVATLADRSDGIAVLYFVGHGLVSPSGALHLATRRTDQRPNRLAHTAMPYATVRRTLLDGNAGTVVVVLDSCFSGRAVQALGAGGDLAALSELAGGYVLTSAGPNELSFAPDGLRHTAFSGALLRLLTDGDPDADGPLRLKDVHRRLARTLPAAGYPAPMSRSTGRVAELVVAANPAGPAAARPTTPSDECPYQGLATFDESSARWFFGREELTEQLVARLAARHADPRPLLVTGASGGGKSSLVRAGLLPAVSRGELGVAGSAGWPRVVLRPGADLTVTAELIPADGPAVIVVDQAEELFTAGATDDDRSAFVRALSRPGLLTVLAIRADALGRCAELPELAPALADPFLVGAMTIDQVRAGIERPATAAGLRLETGLAELILADLGTSPDAPASWTYESSRLPFLSHTLLATWRNRDGDRLTTDGYRATGGIKAAVTETASRAYGKLGPEVRDTARDLLLQLVRMEGDSVRARRVERDRLMTALARPEHAAEVLAAFTADDARLLTTDERTITVTHEALLHAWPLLGEWIEQERDSLPVAQRTASAAYEWMRDGRDGTALLRGDRLAQASAWAERQPDRVAPLTSRFLDASRRAGRRRRNRRIVLAATIGVLLMITGAAAAVAVRQRDSARDSAAEVTTVKTLEAARELRARAASLRDGDPAGAIRLALAASRVDDSRQSRSVLVETLVKTPFAGVVGRHDDEVHAVAATSDARLLATGAVGGSVRLWDLTTPAGTPAIASFAANGEAVLALAFSPDGKTLVTGGADETAVLWDVSDPRHPAQSAVVTSRDSWVSSVAFDRTGRLLAVGSSDRTVVFWDVTDTTAPRRLGAFGDREHEVTALAFSPSAALIVVASTADNAILLDVTDPAKPRKTAALPGHDNWMTAVAFSPDGKRLALGSRDATVSLWDVTDPRKPDRLAVITEHIGTVMAVGFAPDGRTLTTAGDDRRLITWDLADARKPRRTATLAGHTDSVWAFAYAGDHLFSGSSDRSVIAWHPGGAVPSPGGTLRSETEILAAAISPTERTLVTASDENGDAQVWDLGVETPRPAGTLDGDDQVFSVAYAPGGDVVVTGDGDGYLRFWNVRDPARPVLLSAVRGHTDVIMSLAFSRDGTRLATGAYDRSVVLWDVRDPADPKRGPSLGGHAGGVSGVAFAPDGRTLLTADRSAVLWDIGVDPPTRLAELTGHFNVVNGVAFSPDGSRVAASSADRTTSLWDVRDRAGPVRLSLLAGHDGFALTAAFHPTAPLLAVGGYDHTTQLWDVTDPVVPLLVATLGGHTGGISRTLFAPSSPVLITTSEDHTAVLWKIHDLIRVTTYPREEACHRIGGTITADEWNRLLPGITYHDPCAT